MFFTILLPLLLPLLSAIVLVFLYTLVQSKSRQAQQPAPKWPEQPCRLITSTGILSRPEIPRSHYAVHNAQLMALTHNTMCRALNAIHTQALSVKPGSKDARDILLYTSVIYDFIHDHHTIEEKIFFPRIEAATGQSGLMEDNVEQHHKLEGGLAGLRSYAISTKPEHYDGHKLREVIQNLADCLVEHLHEEIPTILNLWDKLPSEELRKIYKAMHDEAERTSNPFKAAPLVLGCQDKNFLIDGEFVDFPELPTRAINYVVDWVLSKKHAGAWRFNPSTMYAEPRLTTFFPSSSESLPREEAKLKAQLQ